MRTVFNFSAGPAMLPEEVLLQAQAELLDWNGTGMSIMELGHRGDHFSEVANRAEKDLRELLSVPTHYQVLFLAGGATTQFAMVPLNLLSKKEEADYVDTGIWSKKAIHEAKRYGKVNIASQIISKDGLMSLLEQKDWNLNPNAAYLHYTPNETIEGIQFKWVPKTGDVPLVADMSSMLLSEPIPINQYGIIYAGAQKNLGQAGITIVIIRDDLVEEARPQTPTLYQYKVQAENKSFYNTPPTFAWYLTGLVLEWLKKQGGVESIHKINIRKADKLYHLIDQNPDFYINTIHPTCRSIMNVPFNLTNESLTSLFLKEASQIGLKNLKGHRLGGGVRASIYNAMPEEGVDRLVEFMKDFLKKNG